MKGDTFSIFISDINVILYALCVIGLWLSIETLDTVMMEMHIKNHGNKRKKTDIIF